MVDTNITFKKKKPVVLISVCSLPRKNIRGHTQSPKLENPAGDGALVGSTEEEQTETSTTGFVWPVVRFAAKKEHSKF
jgi:hypothetical protein